MSQLLLECYNVPAVSYGTDALYSMYYSQGILATPIALIIYSLDQVINDGLIISSGNKTSHVIPVIDRQPQCNHAMRYPVIYT